MPETLGLAGPCRYLFAQRAGPGAWDREDIPSSGGLQWHYRLIRLVPCRCSRGHKTSIDGRLPGARLSSTEYTSPTLQTSLPGVHRWGQPSAGDAQRR
jgi:hypothetical protein